MEPQRNQDPARVRRKRIEAGLTQGALAAKSEISQAYMSMLEKGSASASPPVLSRIARALGCEIPDLMPPEPLAQAASASTGTEAA